MVGQTLSHDSPSEFNSPRRGRCPPTVRPGAPRIAAYRLGTDSRFDATVERLKLPGYGGVR
jgi:hypothetical protein